MYRVLRGDGGGQVGVEEAPQAAVADSKRVRARSYWVRGAKQREERDLHERSWYTGFARGGTSVCEVSVRPTSAFHCSDHKGPIF